MRALVPLVHSIVTHISQRLNKQLTNESMTAPFDLYEVGKSVRLSHILKFYCYFLHLKCTDPKAVLTRFKSNPCH